MADLQTAALVARDGSMDWLCLPRFDSSAAFASLLGGPKAGRWRIAPLRGGACTRRAYRDDTMILESTWETDEGTVTVIDFMPIRQTQPDLIRIVVGVSGRVRMGVELVARFDYGRVVPWVRHAGGRWVAVAGPDSLWLDSPVRLKGRNMRSLAEFTVEAGQRVPFVLTWVPSHADEPPRYDPEVALEETERFWTEWIGRCTYDGRYSGAVRRSLLVLKALTYAPSGGITAAATTSLPGADRRPTQLGLPLLLAARRRLHAAGPHRQRVHRGGEGLARLAAASRGRRPRGPADHVLAHRASPAARDRAGLARRATRGRGRCGSATRPPGSSSSTSTASCSTACTAPARPGLASDHDAWTLQSLLTDYLEGAWQRPDSSLWEVRGPQQHFVHSKVMAWVGLDRMIDTAERSGLRAPLKRWRATRDTIHAEVCAQGYDAERGTFTQYYGSTGLDAALLLIPRVGFLPPTTRVSWARWMPCSVSCARTGSCCATAPTRTPPPSTEPSTGCPARRARSSPAASGWRTPSPSPADDERGARPLRAAARPAQRRRPAQRGVGPARPATAGQHAAGVQPRRAGQHRPDPRPRDRARRHPDTHPHHGR